MTEMSVTVTFLVADAPDEEAARDLVAASLPWPMQPGVIDWTISPDVEIR